MNPKELFVGALVCAESPSGICEVKEILSDHWIDTKGVRHDYERTEPIGLKPEILERLGLEWRAYAVCLSGEDICLVQCGDYWRVKPHQMSDDTICYIYYVHQLQCLLNLCDIDLEITLEHL